MLAVTTIELALRMILALAIMGVVLLAVGRFARRRVGPTRRLAEIEIAARRQLTKSSTLAVVRAGQRHVLVGVNDHAITVLAEGDDLVVDPVGAEVTDAPKTTATTGDQGDAASGDTDDEHTVVDIRTPQQREAMAGSKRRGEARRPGTTTRSAGPRSGVVEVLRDLTVRRG